MVLDDAGYEMGKTYIIEGKYYPRERSKEQMFRGRFKVQLKQSDGELLKENFPTGNSHFPVLPLNRQIVCLSPAAIAMGADASGF